MRPVIWSVSAALLTTKTTCVRLMQTRRVNGSDRPPPTRAVKKTTLRGVGGVIGEFDPRSPRPRLTPGRPRHNKKKKGQRSDGRKRRERKSELLLIFVFSRRGVVNHLLLLLWSRIEFSCFGFSTSAKSQSAVVCEIKKKRDVVGGEEVEMFCISKHFLL